MYNNGARLCLGSPSELSSSYVPLQSSHLGDPLQHPLSRLRDQRKECCKNGKVLTRSVDETRLGSPLHLGYEALSIRLHPQSVTEPPLELTAKQSQLEPCQPFPQAVPTEEFSIHVCSV